MEIETTLEWFYFADADLDSALILNNAYRKHDAIICYHCQQAVRRNIFGFGIINYIAIFKSDFSNVNNFDIYSKIPEYTILKVFKLN